MIGTRGRSKLRPGGSTSKGKRLNGVYPRTAAEVARAFGWGTWKVGWLCEESSGALATVFGTPSLTPVSSPLYGLAGPYSDRAVGFDSTADAFNGGDVHDPGLDDLLVVAVCKPTIGALREIVSKYGGGGGWWLATTSNGVYGAIHDGVDNLASYVTTPGAKWGVTIMAVDRATQRLITAQQTFEGTVTLGALTDVTVVGAMDNASSLCVGASAGGPFASAPIGSEIAAVYIGTGLGAAYGIPANIATALSNFVTYLNTGVAPMIPDWSLVKTAAAGWGTGGAASAQTIAGDGYVEVTVNEIPPNPGVLFGMSASDLDQNYTSITYGLQISRDANGVPVIFRYQSGISGGILSTVSLGDVLRVRRTGAVVTYEKNGVVLSTSAIASSGSLLVDTALFSNQQGNALTHIKFYDNDTQIPITWKNVTGCIAVTGAAPVKTAATAAWDAGASSAQTFAGDGYTEATCDSISANRYLGLSSDDPDAFNLSIEYGLYMNLATANAVQNGGGILATTAVAVGDVLRIERVGSTVYYKKNGTTFYTSLVPTSAPLLVDTALFTSYGVLNDVKLSDNGVNVPITWRNQVGVATVNTGETLYGVTRDATSLKYVPATAAEWTVTLAAAGITTGNPTSVHLCQDLASPLSDAIGAFPMSETGTLTYNNAVPGWSRKGVKTTDGVPGSWSNASIALPDTSVASVMLLAFCAQAVATSADRSVLQMGAGTSVQRTRVNINSAGIMQVYSGANVAVGASVFRGETVRPVVLRRNATAGSTAGFSDQDKVLPVQDATVTGKNVLLSGTVTVAGDSTYLYSARFDNAAAEMTDGKVKALQLILGFSPTWTV